MSGGSLPVRSGTGLRPGWVRRRSRPTRWDFVPPKPRPQTVTRIVSRVSRRTHLTSLLWGKPRNSSFVASVVRFVHVRGCLRVRLNSRAGDLMKKDRKNQRRLTNVVIYIYVAPYSRPVPYSRHPPYSRHFFNDTHENDCVWALFPIAVSGDHFSTQVCKDILSILSIFFGEASLRYHAKLFSPDVSLFHWTLFFLKYLINSRWFRSCFSLSFGLKLPYSCIEHFPFFATIFVAVSTGKFPRARSWVLCSHTKSILALEYSPVLIMKLLILLPMKLLVFQLGKSQGSGLFSRNMVRVWVGIFQFG